MNTPANLQRPAEEGGGTGDKGKIVIIQITTILIYAILVKRILPRVSNGLVKRVMERAIR